MRLLLTLLTLAAETPTPPRVPAGLDATIFAAPPLVNYPVFVAASVDGTVYVSSDKNGSIDRKPNRGSVVRLRDTDGDGRADEAKPFVKNVDSPRGLVWDGDRLYLLHPPHLSAFIDRDGDGVADERKTLVENIAFSFKDRPADHTSNGVTLGVDGWLYLAIGDFGFMQARGADGRTLQLRAGGVVRVRPDGTGLELYARGTRNIVEVGLSPTLDAFSRDNTNDGDGWDVRLHHHVPLAEHGYPSLYKRFADEALAPIHDYGGGSGCGALFLDEPGLPDGFGHALYTADWGRGRVYRHHLDGNGATFRPDQTELLEIPRPTDLDVDGASRITVASWKGGIFNYAGENVGYLVQLRPTDYRAPALPDYQRLPARALVNELASPSHRRRLEAQRALLRRQMVPTAARELRRFAADRRRPVAGRVAAMFALTLGLGPRADIVPLTRDPALRPLALRALAESGGPVGPLRQAIDDRDASVRREAIAGLARMGRRDAGERIARRLTDADPVVAHTAFRALVLLAADDAVWAALDAAKTPTAREAALRVLRYRHDQQVISGLVGRLSRARDPELRRLFVAALARLHQREGQWKGDGWGTRPDTSGPYYQREPWEGTPAVAAALRAALDAAGPEETVALLQVLERHQVDLDDTLDRVLRLATTRKEMVPTAVAQLARREQIPQAALPLLLSAARAAESSPELRADAVVALARTRSEEGVRAGLTALAALAGLKGSRDLQRSQQAFLRSPALEVNHGVLEREILRPDTQTGPWIAAALLALGEEKRVAPEVKLTSARAIEEAWKTPEGRVAILRAATLTRAKSQSDRVRSARGDRDVRVAAAALEAAKILGIEAPKATASSDPLVSKLSEDAAMAAVLERRGDAHQGEQIFQRQGCALCHTVSASEPLRGPFLGNIATLYKRAELAEAILRPNKSLAQGFVTTQLTLKDGATQEGFITREAADQVVLRTISGEEMTVRTTEITGRTKLDRSMMPEGLAAPLTISEFASLLDYLEALAKK